MTLDEAKEIAKDVIANKTRSHVKAARDLSEFVLNALERRACDSGTCGASYVLEKASEEAYGLGMIRGVESIREWMGGYVVTLKNDRDRLKAELAAALASSSPPDAKAE